MNSLKIAKKLKKIVLVLFVVLMATTLISCNRADEFIRQQERVKKSDYSLKIDEAEDVVTVRLIESRGKLKVDDELTGSYEVRYSTFDSDAAPNTVIVDKATLGPRGLEDAFYPFSFDIDIQLRRQTFVDGELVDDQRSKIENGFRGTILDRFTAFGNFPGEDTATIDWEIDEVLE